MKIIETDIIDIHKDNIDHVKVKLAEGIINKIRPLFDEVYSSKINQVEESKKQIQKKKKEVSNDKKILEQLLIKFNRQKSLAKILLKIDKLVSSGIIYDGNIKSEIVVLLKIIDKLEPDKLQLQEKRLSAILEKRFR